MAKLYFNIKTGAQVIIIYGIDITHNYYSTPDDYARRCRLYDGFRIQSNCLHVLERGGFRFSVQWQTEV